MPIDSKIKETVIALMALGIPSSASCEGHVFEGGCSAPWIEIQAPNEPKERFIGEKEFYQKIAKKYGVSFEDVKRGRHDEAYEEALKKSSKNKETPEYKKWREENRKLMDKVEKLLVEFYKNRKVAPNVRLQIEKMKEGDYFYIHNGGKDYESVTGKELTEKEKREKEKRLKIYQEEMKEFAEFLKKKYFES
jgi:hypothetical protein